MMVFSFLLPFRRQRVYRVAETIVVAATVGHVCVSAMQTVRGPALGILSRGEVLQLVPVIMGIMLFARFWKRLEWVPRYPVALMVGVGTGLALRAVDAQVLQIVRSTILSVRGANLLVNFNNLMLMVMFSVGLLYFTFMSPQKGIIGSALSKIGRIGRMVIMVALGCLFASELTGRMTILASIMQFLLFDWLGIAL